MDPRMATVAQGNQVTVGIFPCLAMELLMMYLKARHRTAELATPAIASQNALV
jgi:hypothetical protein